MVVYCDVDGTMTDAGAKGWGNPRPKVIAEIKKAIAGGHFVVVWSARGRRYAREFVRKYGLQGAWCMPKPNVLVDDNPDIRDAPHMRKLSPEQVEETGLGLPSK
jgi:hydroxymethylpyrimidine pyrophosphatase-like HAD family hydrolase